MAEKYDFGKELEKLKKITFEPADDAVRKVITKSNTKMALMSGAIWALALYLVTSYAMGAHGTAKTVLFVIDAVILLVAGLSFIPHKVQVHNEESEITNIHKFNRNDANTWLGTIYVPELDESVEVMIFYPQAANPKKDKNEAPFEEGTPGKVIKIGNAFYISPSFYLDGKSIY